MPPSAESGDILKKLIDLEKALDNWKEGQIKADSRREKRWRRFFIGLLSGATVVIGTAWSLIEFGAWYWGQIQIEKMAERYAEVAYEMFDRENNPDVALNMLDKALELEPDSFEYRYRHAYITGGKSARTLLNLDRPFTKEELDLAHHTLAEAKFLKDLSPDREEPYILEALIYTAQKEYKKAEELINKAVIINPENSYAKVRFATLLYNQGKIAEAQKVMGETAAMDPDSKWVRLWYGIILNAAKKRKEALAEFQKAIEIDPKFDTALYNLGCCYLNARPRQFNEARDVFHQVLKINPSYKEAYYQLGMSYGYEDKYDIALTYMNKAVALSADYLTARNWKALVLFEMKRFEEAVAEYTEAIHLSPQNDDLYVRRAAANIELKKIQDAINDLNFALEINKSNIEAVTILSKAYLQTENYDLALNCIDLALKNATANEDRAELFILRAKCRMNKNGLEAAIADQTEAIQAYRSKYTLLGRVKYYRQAGKIDEALADIGEIYKIDPKFRAARKLEVYLHLNRDQIKALEAVNAYLALSPQDDEIRKIKTEIEQSIKAEQNGKAL